MKTQLAWLLILFLICSNTFAQNSLKNSSPYPIKYRSEVDEKFNIKTLTLAPVYDNVGGIYAKPVENLLTDFLKNDKNWGYSEFMSSSKKIMTEEYDSDPNEVLKALQQTKSQGLLTAIITKGTQGINAKLRLYTAHQGLLLIEEEYQDSETFEVAKVTALYKQLFLNLKNRLPYKGLILSRKASEVTVSLGSVNGLQVGQELTLAQIIKINRHPKLHFMVGSEKEIIGKVQITKVEPYLSFARIVFEKEVGVLEAGVKVLPADFIYYSDPTTSDLPLAHEVENSADLQNETEAYWNFPYPTVARAQVLFSQYSESNKLNSGQNLNAQSPLAPGVHLGLRYNIDTDFYTDLNAQINLFSMNNPLSGSSPSSINAFYSHYSIGLGYNLASDQIMRGLKSSAEVLFNMYNTSLSNTSATALTSTSISALSLKFNASIPIDPEYYFNEAGFVFDLNFNTSLKESPVDSGSNSASLTSLGFFGIIPDSKDFRYRIDLTFTTQSSSFSGNGTRTNDASSGSRTIISEKVGIEYLF